MGAAMPGKPDFAAVTAFVGSVMSQYNGALTEAQKEAWGTQ
jgi:hypothetical protein